MPMTHLRAFVTAMAMVAVAVVAPAAQQTRDGASAAPTGTSALTGAVVTDAATPAPVRRAIVTITGSGQARRTIAGDDGRFAFSALPAGQFTVTATRPGYVPSSYGAKRPGRPGTPVALDAGQQTAITIRMPRGAVITGTIRDERGQPAAGVQVFVVDARNAGNASAVTSNETAVVDDRGVYRIYGLLPGDFHVLALARQGSPGEIIRRSEAETDALLSGIARRPIAGSSATDRSATLPRTPPPALPPLNFAPTFFAGTAVFLNASKVTVGAGEERTGIDFTMAPIAMASISGTVSQPGQAAANVQLSIISDGVRLPFVSSNSSNPVLSTPPGADGRFEYTNVAPGRYTITARASPVAPSSSGRGGGGGGASVVTPFNAGGPDPAAGALYASATVEVAGSGAAGVALSLQPGAKLAGRVVFDASSETAPADLTAITVSLSSPTGLVSMQSGGTIIGNPFSAVRPVNVRSDGTFEVSGIAPGRYLLRCTLPADQSAPWWLRTAAAGGRDLIDAPIDVVVGEDITGAVVTFTDRRTELAGALETASGQAAPDYFVVVFPADRALWRAGSRLLQLTRPSSAGTFSIRDLPPGSYRLAALTDVEPADLADRTFLEALYPASLPVTIANAGRTIQNIRLTGGQ